MMIANETYGVNIRKLMCGEIFCARLKKCGDYENKKTTFLV